MTVRELIGILQTVDQDRKVILSKDSEGNGYSPVSDSIDTNDIYVPETTSYGEVWIEELTRELKDAGFTQEDVYDGDDGERAIVLYPIS